MAMNEKEKFDAYMKIAEFGWKSFDGRRQFEWKVTLGFWALLVATFVFVLKEQALIQSRPELAWFVPIGILGYAFLWQRGLWVANRNDKAIADHFLKAADRTVRDAAYVSDVLPPRLKYTNLAWWVGFLGDWSQVFQLMTTAFLAIIVWLLLP